MKGDLLDPKGREIIGMNSTNAMRIITAEQQQQELLLFRCVLCGISEGDSSNLTTQQSQLQTNATVGCGHQFCTRCVERELSKRREFPVGILRKREISMEALMVGKIITHLFYSS
jgi:hypothetical protein